MSVATPTTRYQFGASGPLLLMPLPIGFSPGHKRLASDLVTTTACVRPSTSPHVGTRPSTAIRRTSKTPGVAEGVDTHGVFSSAPYGCFSRKTTLQPVPKPSSGTELMLPT